MHLSRRLFRTIFLPKSYGGKDSFASPRTLSKAGYYWPVVSAWSKMTIRFYDIQKGKIAVGTTLFFFQGNSKTIMAIRLAGGNRMIWSWRDKSVARKDGGIRRLGETQGQLAVGNGGESRYLRTGKGDRYHDARWWEDEAGGRQREGRNGQSLSIRSGTFIDAILLVNWIKRSEMKNRGGRLPWRKGRGTRESERKAVRDDDCRGILSGVKMAL